MISTRRFGRLGNELFQYAALLGYGIKHNLEWSFPRKSNDPVWSPTNFPHLHNEKWVEGREDILLNENWNSVQQYQEIPFQEDWRDKQIVLNGYWQSYKYFDFCKDELLKVFNLPWEFNKGVCSVHVRRGDYLLYPTKHPVVTIEYLKQAIELIRDKKGINKFLIHSDDIPWCVTCGINMFFPDCEFEYIKKPTALEVLVNMSCCEHQIISNSTMSWWAAELNQNKIR